MAQNDRSDLQAILADVFAFSPTDLAANREGRLSDTQRTRITGKYAEDYRTAWILFTVIFGIGLLGFSAEMIRLGTMNARSVLTYLGITVLFGLIVWGVMRYNRYQLVRTLRAGNVQRIQGTVQLLTQRVEKSQVRYFCVGRHQYRIDDYRHFALLQQSGVVGHEAILYASAPWHSVLSVALRTEATSHSPPNSPPNSPPGTASK